MGSGIGTHDLILRRTEPMTSGSGSYSERTASAGARRLARAAG